MVLRKRISSFYERGGLWAKEVCEGGGGEVSGNDGAREGKEVEEAG